MVSGPVNCMDILDELQGENKLKYVTSGFEAARSSGLRAYMKETGMGEQHRKIIYLLIGAALDDSCPHSRDCVFSLMKEGEAVFETAPDMRNKYLIEILRPSWEDYHRTMLEGFDAAVAVGLNDALVGKDTKNPRVSDADRRKIYRIIGDVRRKKMSNSDAMKELSNLNQSGKYDFEFDLIMHVSQAISRGLGEEDKPGDRRGGK